VIISKTPFRVSFFGGGTDYPEHFTKHGGAVLGTAVDKCTYLAATHFYSRLFDYSIRLAYSRVECVPDLDSIQHAPLRECLRWTGVTQDVELDCMAELPSSVGLGTSSSFVVGVLNTLYAFQGRVVHPLDLAYQAIEIEREVLGESVGCQDQTFAAMGGFNLIEFHTTQNIVVHRLPLSPERQAEFEQHLLVVYTGIRRRASQVAARQIKRIGSNTDRLMEMRRMVDQGYEVLAGGKSLAEFGRLLDKGWRLKTSLDDSVSNSQINAIYEQGLSAGAFGGKLLGAGGGGFILFFVPPDRREGLIASLGNLETISIGVSAPGTQIVHASLRQRPLPEQQEALTVRAA
jgi:D-glycero-alpha-D-manno-heptose-7-phosphate kinase